MDARIPLLVAAVALSACVDATAPPPEAGRRLASAELPALYPGGPYDGVAPDGSTFTVMAAVDGTATMRRADGRADTGRWRIEGDHVCFTWTWVGDGKPRCGHIERLADGRFRSVDGAGNEILRFVRR